MEIKKNCNLVIDDDPTTEKLVAEVTKTSSVAFRSASSLLAAAITLFPKAVILDSNVGHPNGGLELIPRLKKIFPHIPIIVTGRPGDRCLAQAMALGAADFINKPIDRTELLARYHCRVNEAAKLANASPRLSFGDISLVPQEALIQTCPSKDSPENIRSLKLHQSSACLLQVLMEAQGEVIQRAQLTAAVWKGTAISANALDQQVHAVRRALSELGSKVAVKAVYGEGFKLVFVLESLSHYFPG